MYAHKIIVYSLLLLPIFTIAQITSGSIRGTVTTLHGELLSGATIKIIHDPTGTAYLSTTTREGQYYVRNIYPGGPYFVEASFMGYSSEKKAVGFIGLGEQETLDLQLTEKTISLSSITVLSNQKLTNSMANREGTILGKDKMGNLPTVGNNIYDFLRTIPQVKLSNTNEGALNFHGQNNRYNAFYIDGAVNNDVFGLSASGTNGGQASIAPLPVDALEQFQVILSPYDVAIGNFTGGSLNAITRMGTNKTEGSLYYFFGLPFLTGKMPSKTFDQPIEQNNYYRKTSGIRLQGAFKPNKVFYFVNFEIQKDELPKPFDFGEYAGFIKNKNTLTLLANSLKATYQYDPGGFQNKVETIHATKLVMRLDWRLTNKNILSISHRFTLGQRTNPTLGDPNTIQFNNNGFLLNTKTNSLSIELKTVLAKNIGNKLLITYTGVMDDRGPLGKSFPRVRINDGEGAIVFGTDISSTLNQLIQNNWTLFNQFNFIWRKHAINFGLDGEYNKVKNAFIQNTFGSYTYPSLSDFLTNNHPSAFQISFPLLDNNNNINTVSSANFTVLKTSFFINDDLKTSEKFSINYGIRIDYCKFLTQPMADSFVNQRAIPIFSKYFDLEGAISGVQPKIPFSASPRIGFVFRVPRKSLSIRGGAGIFSGRIPLVWPAGIYMNNGSLIGGFQADASQLNKIRFRTDPYHQWTIAETGADINKEPLNLMPAEFTMPKLFRTSLTLEKKFSKGWSLIWEEMFSKNLSEIVYTNINLLPPIGKAVGPDNRNIYSSINNGKIPLNADGSNPFDYAILLSNNKSKTGYSNQFTTTLTKKMRSGWEWEINYSLGNTEAVNDGTASINVNQWRFNETVNGKNSIGLSQSDFSSGHKIFIWATKKMISENKKLAFTISFVYTGQSGSPYSFVYGGFSMVRDAGIFGNQELVYIPSKEDLTQMTFLPNPINGIVYSSQQQTESLEKYIQANDYLQNRRGMYAERNGSRLPFSHIVDIKMKQDFYLRIGKMRYQLQVSLDVFNIGNLINKNWGWRYDLPNDHYELIQFAGYKNNQDFTPQYRFNPQILQITPWIISHSSSPAYSAFWTAQIGVRLTFS